MDGEAAYRTWEDVKAEMEAVALARGIDLEAARAEAAWHTEVCILGEGIGELRVTPISQRDRGHLEQE